MKQIILSIEGMTCSACSNGLEKYLNKQPGVQRADVNLVLASANIEYDDSKLTVAQIEKFVAQAGFKSLGKFKLINDNNNLKKDRNFLILFLSAALFLCFYSLNLSFNFIKIGGANNLFIYISISILLNLLFLFYGKDILISGFKNLWHRMPNMDTLVSLSVLSCFAYSLYSVWQLYQGSTNNGFYFETVAMIIVLVKLGRYIDRLGKDKTKDAIRKLVEITPYFGIVKVADAEKKVTIDEITPGDLVVSRAGEKVAVDGEIVGGRAHFDESFLTGESQPVLKQVGSKIRAGSLNYDGYVEYRAEKIGRESTVSEIVRLVSAAAASKAPIARLADIASGYFVPLIMGLAIVTFVGHWLTGSNFAASLMTGVCVLAAACPCALGLAAPLALVVAEGKCLEKGILVKKNAVLETARHIGLIIFDKTGTLTYGKPLITDIISYGTQSEQELAQIAGSIEKKSNHPLATAFTLFLHDNNLKTYRISDFKVWNGMGVAAKINDDDYLLGNAKILQLRGLKPLNQTDEIRLQKQGCSIVYLAKNQDVVGLFGVRDTVRREAPEMLDNLHRMQVQTVMLTGDNLKTAQAAATSLRLGQIIADVSPRQKIEAVRHFKTQHKIVAMCGDGINDSPALAESDIGISFSGATDVAMNAADVVLIGSDLRRVTDLMVISRHTVRIIKQNLFWAFFYNLMIIPAAMGLFERFGIVMNPMLSGLAMVLSSTLILLNTLRLKYTGGKLSANTTDTE